MRERLSSSVRSERRYFGGTSRFNSSNQFSTTLKCVTRMASLSVSATAAVRRKAPE